MYRQGAQDRIVQLIGHRSRSGRYGRNRIGTFVAIGLALGTVHAPVQGQELSREPLSTLPPVVAAQLERRLAALELRIATEGSEAAISDVEAAALEPEAGVAEAAEARALGSVTTSARCREGYVVSGSARVSAADAAIVAEQQVDCDAGGCRAFQVTARRDSAGPFDLQVSVTCIG